jgi:hypothetical protein
MSFQDGVIRVRDILVNRLIRIDGSVILNSGVPESQDFVNGVELTAEIKTTINRFRSTTIDLEQGLVDYPTLSESKPYEEYITLIQQLHLLDLSTLKSNEQKTAFWINLYNSLTVDAVIHFRIKKSVTEGWLDVVSFFEKAAYLIGGQRYSLTDIEHGILRANQGFPYFFSPHFSHSDSRKEWVLPMVDVRIHFAHNCASGSCPPIGFYDHDQVNKQLDLATRNFIDKDISVDKGLEVLSLSSIFRWYLKDFKGKSGVVDFLLKYLPEDDRKTWVIENHETIKFNYKPYDWSLNII